MKKMTFKSRLFGSVCCLSAALLAVSCAQGVDDETYSAGVTNQQLASPAADAITFSYVTDASGNEQVKVEWPVAMGAGGYECAVENVNDPANPETVVDNKVVDGCSLLFPSAEDTNYSVSVKTLGNEKLNNTGAESATVVAFSTMIDGVAVPEGTSWEHSSRSTSPTTPPIWPPSAPPIPTSRSPSTSRQAPPTPSTRRPISTSSPPVCAATWPIVPRWSSARTAVW